MLDRLRTQFTASQERYRSIETLIAQDDRDPTDVERGEMESLRGTMTELQPRIIEAVELERSLAAGSEALATVPASAPLVPRGSPRVPAASPAERFRSWGEYAHAVATGEVDRSVREQVDEHALHYMIEHARAFVDVTTADAAGIMPPVWIRTIADTISAAQPFVEAFSQLPLPDTGMTLSYPSITTRPLVGVQSAEKTEVPSRKTVITAATANIKTYGGGEDDSYQLLQRSDPSYLALVLDLYAEAMAIAVSADAVATAIAAFGAPVDIGLTAVNWAPALADVVASIVSTARVMPDTFAVSTDMWANFAGATDSEGRPLFPNASPMNPVGRTSLDSQNGDVRGLTLVVDPSLPQNRGVLANRAAFTSLLGPVQTLSGDNVAKLGRDLAVFRYAAFIVRRPDAGKVVSMGATP
jgi:hypothetical protein